MVDKEIDLTEDFLFSSTDSPFSVNPIQVMGGVNFDGYENFISPIDGDELFDRYSSGRFCDRCGKEHMFDHEKYDLCKKCEEDEGCRKSLNLFIAGQVRGNGNIRISSDQELTLLS